MTIVTNTFNLHNHPYRVTQYLGGRLEVYRVESGMEVFEGYVGDLDVDLANAAWDAFQAAPSQRYLLDVNRRQEFGL